MDKTQPGKQLFSTDTLQDLASVSSPAISPDGKQVACVVSSIDKEADDYEDSIRLISIETGNHTTVGKGSSPVWSPDGSFIAFMDRDAITIYNVEQQTKKRLVTVYESAYHIDHLTNKHFAWSPDGKTIAYISSAPFEEAAAVKVRQFSGLMYKSKGGRGRSVYADERLSHLWLVNIATSSAELITDTPFNEHSLSWSPYGQSICFVSNITGEDDNNQRSDLFTIELASGNIFRLTNDKGTVFQPAWSPDGKHIAYLATKNEISTNDSPAEDTQLFIIPSAGGEAVCLTRSLDRRVEQLSWGGSSSCVFFTAGDKGITSLYRVLLKDRKIETVITGDFHILEYHAVNGGDKIAYIETGTLHLPDLFILQEGRTGQLTYNRDELLSVCHLAPATSFWFVSFDDTQVQGWIMKPAEYDENKKYPLILVIHGGPHNMFGYEFEDRMQILAAQGYGVVFINPRGSSGYGQDFSNGCVMNWGEGDYKDLMSGMDHVIKNYSWVDESRLGVTGQSYGGYMTNRIITRTKRFSAAVTDGGLSNLVSFSGTSLYHSLMESEFVRPASLNYDLLWRCSPLKDVRNVSTPVLFFHGETDNEVPFSQAEEMYVAVKKLGVETELVQYTGEGHGWRPNLLPSNRKDLFERMINWFKKYIRHNCTL